MGRPKSTEPKEPKKRPPRPVQPKELCKVCGKRVIADRLDDMCINCYREKTVLQTLSESKNHQSIINITEAARAAGMTYGQYVARTKNKAEG